MLQLTTVVRKIIKLLGTHGLPADLDSSCHPCLSHAYGHELSVLLTMQAIGDYDDDVGNRIVDFLESWQPTTKICNSVACVYLLALLRSARHGLDVDLSSGQRGIWDAMLGESKSLDQNVRAACLNTLVCCLVWNRSVELTDKFLYLQIAKWIDVCRVDASLDSIAPLFWIAAPECDRES